MAIRWLTITKRIRCPGLAMFLCLVMLSLRAASAQTPEIINRARLQFFQPAGISNDYISDPVRAVLQADSAALVTFRDSTYAHVVGYSDLQSRLFVEVEAPACNLDSAVIETNVVVLTSAQTGDSESVVVIETAPGSGLFRLAAGCPVRNAAQFPVVTNNHFLETVPNDTITARTLKCGFATTALLIDPGGIVFNSRDNTPVAGARVTLIDTDSGLPATVFGPDGISQAPSTVTTGPDGRFAFPAVASGTYRLLVLPPPGFTAPSTADATSLPPGRIIGGGSYGDSFPVNLFTGPVSLDYPVDPLSTNGLAMFVQKVASRTAAEIGDSVDYTVRIRNISGAALPDVTVTDKLPAGFAYQKRTAKFEEAAVADPTGGAGPTLQFPVGTIPDGATVTLTYRVRIQAGALQGDGVNYAKARSAGPTPVESNTGSARVQVQPGVFTDRGIVLGKVFVDANGNRIQDVGEPGVPGVRIYMEDGTYVITDGEGKYSLYGLSPRTHVFKVDPATLPAGAKLVELSTRNAGSAGSRFVELKRSELHKADFAITAATPEILAEIADRRKKLDAGAAEIGARVKTGLTPDGVLPLRGDPRAGPASGIITAGTASGPAAGATVGQPSLPQNAGPPRMPPGKAPDYPRKSTNDLGALNPLSFLAPGEPPDPPPPRFSPLLPADTLNEYNSELPPSPVASAQLSRADLSLTNLDNSLGFVDLRNGMTLPMAQATVRVKGLLGAKFSLEVNGEKVDSNRLGRRATVTDRWLEVWEFVGVALTPGTNTLEVVQLDPFGNERGSKLITVLVPDRLARLHVILPRKEQFADGHSAAKITVLLEDAHGVPVSARTPITLEAGVGKWQVEDLDKAERGTQVFIEGGKGEFQLLAPIEPGDSRIVASSGVLSGTETLSFLPELRSMLAVGVIEGQISLRKLSANSIVPARSRDGFEEELRDFSVNGNDKKLSAAGRAAFFLKGRIKGEYLLTAGFDSEKETRERLFRDIQPDEFYPVYGDSSVKGFDAQSSGRLYVRVDKRKSYLLYGDYATATPSEARSLGNYSRSLNGIKEHYEKKNIVANAWAAHDSVRQVIEELPAKGISGPYYFGTANGLVNSETVEILIRDRSQPSVILRTQPMARFTDYEFEPFTGRLLFKAPVPSLDPNLNPISIRVTYEVEQGTDKFWVYGADAQWKMFKHIEVGGSGVRDENPRDRYGLYSANTTLKLTEKTYLLGEYAHSDTELIGGGDAWRADFRHQSDYLDARLYWGRAESTFSNTAAILTGGRIEAGGKLSYRVANGTRLVLQGINSESLDNHASRRGIVGGIEQTFANQFKLELGARHSVESAAPASPSTGGVTPNEITSVRAKLTAPIPRLKNARLFGEFENDVVESDKRMWAVGGDYQWNTKTKIYARHEFINSLGSQYELNSSQQRNTTVFGIDTAYMKDGSVFNEYRARDAISGRESEAAIGLRNGWTIADGVRVSTTVERVNPITGDQQTESTAGTAGLEYTRSPNWKATGRIEVRASTQNNSLLNTLGYAHKLNDNWTALSRTILYIVDDTGPTDSDRTQFRFQTGAAWRQSELNIWNGLGKYEFKLEDGVTSSSLSLDRRVHIVSLDANFQPHRDWIFSGHYAGKLVFEQDAGHDDVYHAHLLGFRAVYEITERFDIGLNSSVLFNGDLRGAQYAVGPEIGFTIAKNLRFGVGYNVRGFSDRDLSAENYTQQGAYLALRLKFDESLFKFSRKGEE
jgi:uncharacterized repeat protein (TIGR01451 family)